MNKLLLLCITLFVITHKANGQDITAVEIREKVVGGLRGVTCVHTFTGTIANPTLAAAASPTGNLPTTTDGSGQGAILQLTIASSQVQSNAITVVAAGSGYAVGDIITVAKEFLTDATAAFSVTLVAADIADGSLLCSGLKLASSGNPSNAGESANSVKNVDEDDTNPVSCVGCDGTGIALALKMSADGNEVDTATVSAAGSGYKVGDVIKVPKETFASTADNDLLLTLTAADFQDIGKTTVTGGFRDSEGNINAFTTSITHANTVKGYYTTLSKNTNGIQVKASYSNAGSVTPELNGVTDTTLANNVLSSQIFTVKDGLNTLKLVSSVDGTYEINLIKPDDYVKAIKMGKRSVEISYNPGSAGEFTCSAFADRSGLPTTRDNVKTGTGSVAKSVRTHNILPENRYNSVQMTLNGLSPSTIYDIHCFHLSHGIISNTAASVETDLASLTGVSLVPNAKTGGVTPSTLTLKFTHETSLASGFTVKLVLYNDYDTAQTVTSANTNSGADCGLQITTETSGGLPIAGSHSCAVSAQAPFTNTNLLTLTMNGPSNVASGTRGTEVILVLTDDGAQPDDGSGELNLDDNPETGSVVTFDLVVDGHAPLLQQDGFITT